MIFVPLPFLGAALLAILFIVIVRNNEGGPANWPFAALVAVCAMQSLLLGLRWGYGVQDLRFVLPVVGAYAPPLAYASFRRLVGRSDKNRERVWWSVLMWPAFALVIPLIAPILLDAYLVALSVGYAIAILMLGRSGPDGLDEARLEGADSAHKAILMAAATLCFSALCDLVVFADFELRGGANVAFIAANANLFGLLLIGATVAVAARASGQGSAESDEVAQSEPSPLDREILEKVQNLLEQKKLYLDEALTLSRLARRATIPARHISEAINRTTGKNVSQFVNTYRIEEVCRLLEDPEQSVTAAMFAAGFQTKSNFNREFKRVTGTSPAQWREQHVEVEGVRQIGAHDPRPAIQIDANRQRQ